jgi:hypothetical protein
LGFKGDIIDIDISSHIYDRHFEIKNTKNLSIPAWIRQTERDCPVTKTPTLVFKHKGKWYLLEKLNDWLGDQLTIQDLRSPK